MHGFAFLLPSLICWNKTMCALHGGVGVWTWWECACRILLNDSTQAQDAMKTGFRRDKISQQKTAWLEQGSFTASAPPTVGSPTDRTWRRASSSQLQGGYVQVNSAARERTPNLLFKDTRLYTCSFWAAVKSPPLPFSASLGKSVISEAENGRDWKVWLIASQWQGHGD